MVNQTVSQYLWWYLQQKGPRYTKTKLQSIFSVWLVSMFTDAHLHYTVFELLESVDNQATNPQSIFLPCNLFVKHETSNFTADNHFYWTIWRKHVWKPKMAAKALSQTLLLAALPLVNG